MLKKKRSKKCKIKRKKPQYQEIRNGTTEITKTVSGLMKLKSSFWRTVLLYKIKL